MAESIIPNTLNEQISTVDNKANIALIRAFPSVKTSAGIGSSAIGGFTITSSGYGVIFHGMVGCVKLHFTIAECPQGEFIQAGLCARDAALPNIMNTGAGRIVYNNFPVTGDCVFTFTNYADYDMFICGGPGIKVYKIWCEMVV